MSTQSQSIIPKTINPDLQKERDAASFNVEEFAAWFYGGADKLKFKRELEHYMFKDMQEDNTLLHYKSHEEVFEMAVKQAIEVIKKLQTLQQQRNPGGKDIWPGLFSSSHVWGAMPAGNPFGVHIAMMGTTLRTQGTDEQYEKFGKRADNLELVGTYAQTELGHGTFLRGLETRADYDRKTQEFVLNSPTISAYKWWPGGLGHCSNYCLVVAQLYIDDVPKGVHMFFVPLRDEQTHLPLPGIDIGEIGKKMGFYGVNNGFLGLKQVRIPRENMLMRNAKVNADGSYVSSPNSALTYFTMVYIRCMIACNNATLLAMGTTIATRYAAVRRQSPINASEAEPQIMQHVTQQLKLFPEIAGSVAYRLAANCLWQLYSQTYAELEQGEYARLPEMHALACSLKVLAAADSADGIDRLRKACGGHGYLSSSNMGTLFIAATAACTYEGENTVLLLQVGRFLMKAWRAANAGEQLVPTAAYLGVAVKQPKFGQWTGSADNLVKALQFVAANKTRLAAESLQRRLKSGQSQAEAANNTGIELTQAAELHGRAFICANFLEQVTGRNSRNRTAALNGVLQQLLNLYLVQTILKNIGDVLRFIPLDEAQVSALQMRLESALQKLRPDAVAICDGFDFHDRTLSSALGAYDGNVYERMFELAKQSPLNKTPVPKVITEYLQPFMRSQL